MSEREAARHQLAFILQDRRFPYGGKRDGFVWIDADAAHAIADFLTTLGYRRVPAEAVDD